MGEPVHLSILLDAPHSPGSGDPPEAQAAAMELKTGEPVSGTLMVDVREEVEFTTLRVGFAWHTEGKGNPSTGGGGCAHLAQEGLWRAGERHLFPFSLTAPRGPLSYQGKILKLMWDLEARLERSMLQQDLLESLPIRLVADPEGEEFDLGPAPQKRDQLEAAKRGLGGLWITFAIVLFLGALILGASHNWEFALGGKILVFLLLSGGFLLTLKGIWGRLGRGKLGEPVIQLSTTELRRGEGIRFSLAMRPDQRTELRTLDVILECEERVVHGHGQYQSHHRRVVYEKRLSLAEDVLVEPHRGFRRKGTLTLPDEAPPSLGVPFNQVVWWLRFQGDIVGWPDWKEPFLLTVRP